MTILTILKISKPFSYISGVEMTIKLGAYYSLSASGGGGWTCSSGASILS